MPFVTEELWQRLPKSSEMSYESIMLSPFPQSETSWDNGDVDSEMDFINKTAQAIRGIRSGRHHFRYLHQEP